MFQSLLLGKSQTKAAGTRDDPTRWDTQDGIPDWIIHRPDGNKEGCSGEESEILSFLDNPVSLPHHHSSTHTHTHTHTPPYTYPVRPLDWRTEHLLTERLCGFPTLQLPAGWWEESQMYLPVWTLEPWNSEQYTMKAQLCPLSLWVKERRFWGFIALKWLSDFTQSFPILCDPIDDKPPGSSVHGILQARILEWVAISFSRGSSWHRDWTQVSYTAGRLFIIWASREVVFVFFIALRTEANGSRAGESLKPHRAIHCL